MISTRARAHTHTHTHTHTNTHIQHTHTRAGNRVTCRDWFQLTLKEGLTVFRDQEFSSDMNSR